MTEDDGWVVLHCYAGFESAVMQRILRSAPGADVRRLRRDGVALSGFLLWRWDGSSWDSVRNAGGVTGFVGDAAAPTLYPLSQLEE